MHSPGKDVKMFLGARSPIRPGLREERYSPMATIKHVAKLAGVSVGTVSNVLSGAAPLSAELRERVYATMRKLEYHPNFVARSLSANRTNALGMIISDITNPFFPQVVRGAEDCAFKYGYLLI